MPMSVLVLIFKNRFSDSQRRPGRNENCEVTPVPEAWAAVSGIGGQISKKKQLHAIPEFQFNAEFHWF